MELGNFGTARHRGALFTKGQGAVGETEEYLLNEAQIVHLIGRSDLPNLAGWRDTVSRRHGKKMLTEEKSS
jgi:hypothetical protein